MNSPQKSSTYSFYTKCDSHREATCISRLQTFAVELCRHRARLEGYLHEWPPRLDQMTVYAMKLHILARNKQDEFVVYDELVAANVASEIGAQQRTVFDALQDDLRGMGDSFVRLREAYDAFNASTEQLDWNVNSPLITGDLQLTPLRSLLAEACNIVFYFKVLLENLIEKVNCAEVNGTEAKCVRTLLDNARISNAFLQSFDDFVAACRKQFARCAATD